MFLGNFTAIVRKSRYIVFSSTVNIFFLRIVVQDSGQLSIHLRISGFFKQKQTKWTGHKFEKEYGII